MMDYTHALNKYAENLVGTRDKSHYLRYTKMFLEADDGMDK